MHQTVISPLLQSKANVLQTSEVIEANNLAELISSITEGNTILYFHAENLYLSIKTFSAPTASITDTDTESSVIGPQNAFVESMEINLSLIKRRIKNPNLKSQKLCCWYRNQYESFCHVYRGNCQRRKFNDSAG